jgi:hypothetical protein
MLMKLSSLQMIHHFLFYELRSNISTRGLPKVTCQKVYSESLAQTFFHINPKTLNPYLIVIKNSFVIDYHHCN